MGEKGREMDRETERRLEQGENGEEREGRTDRQTETGRKGERETERRGVGERQTETGRKGERERQRGEGRKETDRDRGKEGEICSFISPTVLESAQNIL